MSTATTLAVEGRTDGPRFGIARSEKKPQGSSKAMSWVATRMLTGDRAEYIALVFAISFSSVLIARQASILAGLMNLRNGSR